MYVDQISINYSATPLEITDGDECRLTISRGGHSIKLIPDELAEICRIAKLLGWEDFRNYDH